MACFVVPMAEAIIVSVVKKVVEKKEQKALFENLTYNEGIALSAQESQTMETGLSWSQKLSWLNTLLWGGVFLLAIEHIWHGEVILWPPFLTAMKNPSDIPIMLHEMASFGTSMAIFVTMVWVVMVFVAEYKMKRFLCKSLDRS